MGLAIGKTTTTFAPVRRSKELERVLAIPKAHIWTPAERDAMREEVTLPGARMRLSDTQVNALLAVRDARGLVAPLGVGVGKTLIACLIPTVLDTRGLVLAPASLLAQARTLCEEYRTQFRIRDDMLWLSYHTLSDKRFADILENMRVGVLVCDEAHYLRNRKSARGRRFTRYANAHTSTHICVMSGTLIAKSIKDVAHLLYYAQGDNYALPRGYPEMCEWSEALDIDPIRPPGALKALCSDGETPREGWFRRLREIPGVVADPGRLSCAASLVLRDVGPPALPEPLLALQRTLRETWCMPYGPVDMAAHMASCMRQIRVGGYYEPIWSPTVSEQQKRDYRHALSDWNRWVHEKLTHSRTYDSPGQMLEAIVAGSADKPEVLAVWEQVREATPKPALRWKQVHSIAHLVKPHLGENTLVWTDYVGAGKALACDLGLPFFGAGSATPTGGSAVLSIRSHGTGRNLQAYSHSVVVGGTPGGALWEQLLGRTHRQGQCADTVYYDLMWAHEARGALKEAEFIHEITGQPQRLLAATWASNVRDA